MAVEELTSADFRATANTLRTCAKHLDLFARALDSGDEQKVRVAASMRKRRHGRSGSGNGQRRVLAMRHQKQTATSAHQRPWTATA
jgi:hypothetical protein